MHTKTLLAFLGTTAGVSALAVDRSEATLEKRACPATINQYSDVAGALACTAITINAFTVPVATVLNLALKAGSVVTQNGDITFATGKDYSGNMMQVSGTGITWNNPSKFKLNGNGAYWWDGQGSNGGRTKPHPMVKITATGTINDMYIFNAPVQAFSISNAAALHMVRPVVKDVPTGSTTNFPHNTDAFDVSASSFLTISNAQVDNQDDCIAINDATDLVFENSVCNGGHGISVGSIKTGKNVARVTISGNKVTNSQQGLRIKTYVGATDASVKDITYIGNTITGSTSYGIVIQQDYTNEGATGNPSSTVPISNISFKSSKTVITGNGSKAKPVYVNCGKGSCTGTWDWSFLDTTGAGGLPSNITGLAKPPITGWSGP